MNEQPLAGITALDFGQVYNGPYCGFLLAQAGARVIKVESLIGETLRTRGSASSASYPFANFNTNKECITLNIKTSQGQDLIRRLVKKVDVLLQNFAPGTLEKFKLGPEDLRAINPRLIYAMSTGYGAKDGPYKDYLGMDITLQAMSGSMSVTGDKDGPPMKTSATFADILGGTHLYAGIVTALLARATSGVGATVDISMQDCVFPTLATAIGSYYALGEQPPRSGNRHPAQSLAPYNVYQATDGHVAIICIREGHWRKLCAAMGQAEIAEDPRFATMERRARNIDEVDELVNNWTRQHTRGEITHTAQEYSVICAPVNNLEEAVNDLHMLARGSLVRRPHQSLGEIAQFQTPLRFAGIEPPALQDVPSLGEHTDAILTELADVDEAELSALRQAEAIL